MLPIAVLPVAGILLRLGQPDLLDIPFIAAAGDAIFHNLGLLFAIGVAVGFARDGNGAAGLAGVVCFLVATNGAEALIAVPPAATTALAGKAPDLAMAAYRAAALAKLGVPLGILSGLTAGLAYNRFGGIRLPDYLAFFGGRRFVPIVSGVAGLVLALLFGSGFAALDHAIDAASRTITAAGPAGLFVYGLLNRLLLVTGLHHILNNVVWFILGNFHGATGDLNRFFAGDPSAGTFMAGFFPVMIFGLPAGCFAMYRSARPERRAEVGGLLLSLALTAMLTGVTEPIEFTFMFLAPVLFGVHAVLTGLAMVLMDALHVRLGFGFSAGLFDYALNFGRATRPLLLLPVGMLYAVLYYSIFRWFIVRFDLPTPGRDAALAPSIRPVTGNRACDYVTALGGAPNLTTVDACTTRLRLTIADPAMIDEAQLKLLGARGVVRPSSHVLQVVIGPAADLIAREIRDYIEAISARPRLAASNERDAATLLTALGGPENVAALTSASSRLLITVHEASLVDKALLRASAPRGFIFVAPQTVHVIVGSGAAEMEAAMQQLF